MVIDMEAAAAAEVVEGTGREVTVEMEWETYSGVKETYSYVEPVVDYHSHAADAYVEYVVTVVVGGVPAVRARYDASEEVEEALYANAAEGPSYSAEELLEYAPEWVADDFLGVLTEDGLASVVEEAGGSMTSEELAARFSDDWDSVEVLA